LIAKSRHSEESKKPVLEECRQVGNASPGARRHQISRHTVNGWMRAERLWGSNAPLPRDEADRLNELKRRLSRLSEENDQLERIIAEK
jgi:transposase-like protein